MKVLVPFVVAALVATGPLTPAAVAADRPDDRAGLRGVGGVDIPAHSQVTPGSQWERLFERDLPDGADVAPASPTTVVARDGFDWGDAGIGLAAGLGLMLVLAGLLASLQYVRRVESVS